MRSAAVLATTMFLAMAAVGCGSDDDASSTPDSTVGPARWSTFSVPATTDTDVEIVVEVGSSSCDSFDRVEVDETADAVTIDAYVSSRNDDVCTADVAVEQVTVTLDEPLGERSLLGCRPNQDDDASFDCR